MAQNLDFGNIINFWLLINFAKKMSLKCIPTKAVKRPNKLNNKNYMYRFNFKSLQMFFGISLNVGK